jgi:hypothetical protein
MSRELLIRAEAIKARNQVLESVPGSGYHDNDRDHRSLLRAPHRRHLPGGQRPGTEPLARISDHLVPFYSERSIEFAGPCAERAFAALQSWYEAHRTSDAAAFSSYTGTDRKLLIEIPKLAVKSVDGLPSLTIWRDTWNDVLHALYSQGIGLSGAPLEPAE